MVELCAVKRLLGATERMAGEQVIRIAAYLVKLLAGSQKLGLDISVVVTHGCVRLVCNYCVEAVVIVRVRTSEFPAAACPCTVLIDLRLQKFWPPSWYLHYNPLSASSW